MIDWGYVVNSLIVFNAIAFLVIINWKE